jgi:tetratricopeptide (TPR) repeat protein
MHGDSQAALQWYRRACDVRPEDQVLRSTYSELANRLGRAAYQPTRVGLARLYLRNDLYAHALREWESLAQETPDLLEAQVGLAETLWRVERADEAQALCEHPGQRADLPEGAAAAGGNPLRRRKGR